MLAKNGTVQFQLFTRVHQLCVCIYGVINTCSTLICGSEIYHRAHAVAGGLLKGYQHVANEISLIAFGHSSCAKPDPASMLSFFFCLVFKFIHLCLIYLYIIILHISPWTVRAG